VGRFFSTIVGFVEARRMVIAEGTEAIAEAVTSGRMKDEEKKPVRPQALVDGRDPSRVEVLYRGYP